MSKRSEADVYQIDSSATRTLFKASQIDSPYFPAHRPALFSGSEWHVARWRL